MKFKEHINTFFRTVRAYNDREKVLSQVILALVIIIFFKMLFFSGPAIYTEGYVGRIVSLNPVFSDLNEVDRDVSNLVFSGLMRYDPDTGAVISDMAALKVSEDKNVYTFILKDYIKWHDGKVVTAEDVYFTFHDIIQNPEFTNPILKANFDGVEIKQIDERTITFTLGKPNSFFITNTTTGILPKHILGEVLVPELAMHEFNTNPIGTGPYKVNGRVKSNPDGTTSVKLAGFRDYYGEHPQISDMEIIAYPSVDHLVDDRENVNSLSKITGIDADPIREDSDYELIPYRLPQYTALFMNMDSNLLKHKKIRVGVMKAIEKNKILTVLNDIELIDTPLLELNTDEWIYEPGFDEANGALYDSGYKYLEDEDRYRKDEDGNELVLRFVVRQYPLETRLALETQDLVNFLVNSWAEVGIKVIPEWYEMMDFNEMVQARDYDLLLAGQSLGYNLDTFAYWHSSQIKNGLNLSNYKSFKADTLLEEVRDTFDEEEKQGKLFELATQMADDVPALILYRPVYYFATDGAVDNISVENLAYPGDRYMKIAEWRD
ncbi:MAG: ABC transporter substrate-binding protein [Patescibacteria group bacterium]|nr:hypothetical protein [Patescibacteria group bacterium]